MVILIVRNISRAPLRFCYEIAFAIVDVVVFAVSQYLIARTDGDTSTNAVSVCIIGITLVSEDRMIRTNQLSVCVVGIC